RLAKLVAHVDEAFDAYEFSDVTRELYSFFWNEFCDWYIEFSKSRLQGDDAADRLACQRNLVFVLDVALRLLHPIMPFVTEEIYQELPIEKDADYLIVAHWPEAADLQGYIDDDSERAIQMVCDVVSAVRANRSRYGISPKTPMQAAVKAEKAEDAALLEGQRGLIEGMGRLDGLAIATDTAKPAESAATLVPGLEVYVVLSGLVDFDAERARLLKQSKKLEGDLAKLDKKLHNPGFLAKAAPDVVAKDRAKFADLTDELSRVKAQIAEIA
ncbi:MAG: class I tRNA ligase family protein, partial [Eggerthellaceae bacterium]|nr:class I tRNA ligase family protein [Eggerthellaceae bacterium]